MEKKTNNIIWKPQPKQIEFMQRPEYEALYGGAAGGGKSDALLNEALRQINVKNYRGIIFRDTVPQLEGLISRSHEIYPRIDKKAKYNENKKQWLFKSGAKIFFGYMEHENDKFNYQGKAYDFIGFDELTHFTRTQYLYLMSRNRPVGPGTRVYIRATANPDGKGLGWVKDRFITPVAPNTPMIDEYQVVTPDGQILKLRKKRIFIPSTVFDNQELLKNDPNYLATLAALPEAERNALLYGSWESFSGQVFTEWRNDPEHYDDGKFTHVINPFNVPQHWTVYRGYDFGYSKPFSVGWYAVDDNGKIYRIREFYGCNGEPNVGIQLDPKKQAQAIKEIEETDPLLKGRTIRGIADPAIFEQSTGESVADMMEAAPNFIYFDKGDHKRIPGKMQFHYRFAFDEDGDCMFQVFNTCKHFIRTIPNLVYSTKQFEDIDTDAEDHIYDECRYVLMEHPIPPRANVLQKPKSIMDSLDIKNTDVTEIKERKLIVSIKGAN